MKLLLLLFGFLFLTGCVSASLDDVNLQAATTPETTEPAPSSPTVLNQDLTQLRTSTQNEQTASLQQDQTLQPLQPSTPPQTTASVSSSVPAPNSNSFAEVTSEEQRQVGIEQIRAKASNAGSARPNINSDYAPATKHLTKEQQRLKRAELHAEALAASGTISNEELLLRKRRIAELSRKASTHYRQAVRQISK